MGKKKTKKRASCSSQSSSGVSSANSSLSPEATSSPNPVNHSWNAHSPPLSGQNDVQFCPPRYPEIPPIPIVPPVYHEWQRPAGPWPIVVPPTIPLQTPMQSVPNAWPILGKANLAKSREQGASSSVMQPPLSWDPQMCNQGQKISMVNHIPHQFSGELPGKKPKADLRKVPSQTALPYQPEKKEIFAVPIQPELPKVEEDGPEVQLKGMKICDVSHQHEVKQSAFCLIPKRHEGRPSKEIRGRPIEVHTNHLKLDFKYKNAIILHYDVSIEPEKPYKFYREALELVRRECFPKNFPSFDGKKNLYSIKKLPFNEDVLIRNVTLFDKEKGKDREMTVKIKWANNVNMSSVFDYMKNGESINIPQEAIQAIDIVLRQPSARYFCQVGRSFFTPPQGQVVSLGDGLDLWYGFFQSAIVGWKCYLNVDVVHKGFPSPVNCIEALSKTLKLNNIDSNVTLDQYGSNNFASYIKGLKIEYTSPRTVNGSCIKKTYKVIDLGRPVLENFFDSPTKGRISVYQHFREEYGYSIQFVNLPTLQCGSKSMSISLPMELCKIQEGQVVMKKLNETQTRNMVRLAAAPAYERKKKIEDSVRSANFNNDPCVQEFGISVSSEFSKIPARILDPPTLEYRQNQQVNVTGGVWRPKKFIKTCVLEEWYIYSADNYVNDRKLKELSTKLIEVGKEVGMVIKEPKGRKIISNFRNLESDLSSFGKAQVVFVILPERGPITYGKVKQAAELRLGLLTQCIKSRTIMKCNNNATVTNILMKLNAKLNGINHSITSGHWPSFFKEPVMVVGADVTHPNPDQFNVPSVAAVVASHDPKAYLYNMIYKIQPAKEEIIKDLENIMKDQLMFFYRKTNYKPRAILFYRDGVSEGQFRKVLEEEVLAIRRACIKLSRDYEPPITFFVVQKRHHTRLFPGPNEADGRNKNVPAGTIVDTEIVHPTEMDFYLVSHASIQGTSRPTKYHLLCNDSHMTQDDLEEITYYLCHLFTRCTRSVSYPAPTYYAHLAAFRIRSYIDTGINMSNLKLEEKKREIKPAFAQNSPMFFV